MDFYLQRALGEIESTTRSMNLEELRAHPPGKWCAAEILEHLALTFSSTARGLQRRLDSGELAARKPSLRERVITLIVIEAGYFPSGLAAPEYVRPCGLPAETIRETIRNNLLVMDRVITECEGRFGSVRIANHPIVGPLTARQWRRFHWIHTAHHMKQISRLQVRKSVT